MRLGRRGLRPFRSFWVGLFGAAASIFRLGSFFLDFFRAVAELQPFEGRRYAEGACLAVTELQPLEGRGQAEGISLVVADTALIARFGCLCLGLFRAAAELQPLEKRLAIVDTASFSLNQCTIAVYRLWRNIRRRKRRKLWGREGKPPRYTLGADGTGEVVKRCLIKSSVCLDAG